MLLGTSRFLACLAKSFLNERKAIAEGIHIDHFCIPRDDHYGAVQRVPFFSDD